MRYSPWHFAKILGFYDLDKVRKRKMRQYLERQKRISVGTLREIKKNIKKKITKCLNN